MKVFRCIDCNQTHYRTEQELDRENHFSHVLSTNTVKVKDWKQYVEKHEGCTRQDRAKSKLYTYLLCDCGEHRRIEGMPTMKKVPPCDCGRKDWQVGWEREGGESVCIPHKEKMADVSSQLTAQGADNI